MLNQILVPESLSIGLFRLGAFLLYNPLVSFYKASHNFVISLWYCLHKDER